MELDYVLWTGICTLFLGFSYIFLWYKDYRKLRPRGVDFNNQSVEIQNGIRIRNMQKDHEELGFNCPQTIFGYFVHGRSISGRKPCLGFRADSSAPYTWITYDKVYERILSFGAGLRFLGLKPGAESQSFVGIYAKTCPEWVIAEYGSYAFRLTVVPLYDALGADTCQRALNKLQVQLLICGNEQNLKLILSGDLSLQSLKTVVLMDTISDTLREEATSAGLKLYSFNDVEDFGKANPIKEDYPHLEDKALLMFTSGTTGEPKAAILTHNAVATAVREIIIGLLPTRVTSDTVGFAYLPLAHIMERIVEMATFVHGGRVGFNSSGTSKLIEDIQELKPDLLVLVPRVLNRVYGKMLGAVRGSIVKQAVLKVAIFFKSLEMKYGIFRKDSIWDKIVFHKIQNILGGRVRICATGSAPLEPEMTNSMRAALGCYIFEVYGQTETSGALTGTLAGDPVSGHCGVPLGGIEIKLIDVPELGYFARDGKGEICARGQHLMSGYYGLEKLSAETIDENGFVHTGDVGEWIAGGRLRIIDRKKHIFKLSQGEYIAPEKVENELMTCPLISQIFVDGNSLQPFTVALVFPNYELIPEMKGRDEETKRLIVQELSKTGKDCGLKSYEIPKRILLLTQPLTLEDGFMTPTQKIKREVVRLRFRSKLHSLYDGISITD